MRNSKTSFRIFFFFSYANRIFRFKLISCYGCDNSHQICEIRKLLSSLFFSYAKGISRFKLISCYGCDNSHQICEIRKLLSAFFFFFFFHMRTEFLNLNLYHVTDVIIHIKYAKFEKFFPHFFLLFICEQNFSI